MTINAPELVAAFRLPLSVGNTDDVTISARWLRIAADRLTSMEEEVVRLNYQASLLRSLVRLAEDNARELAELIATPHTEPGWLAKRNAVLAKARSAGLLPEDEAQP